MERVLRLLQVIPFFSQSQGRTWVKVIDWYLMREVLIPLLYSLFAFVMLFVIYDLSVHFSEIFEHGVKITVLIQYYLVSIPYIFVNCMPIAVLMATLYCLGQLGSHSEITALQANGVSLPRLSLPFVAVGVGMSLVVFLANEKLVPKFSQMSQILLEEEIKKKSPEESEVWNEFAYKSPATQRYWVGSYDPRKKLWKDAVIREFRRDGSLENKYAAEEARWVEGSWWLKNGNLTIFDVESKQLTAENFSKKELRLPGKRYEEPDDFTDSKKDPFLMSFPELREHMKMHDKKDAVYQSEKVDLHYKVSFPFISLVVIFLGVPLGLRNTGRRGGGALAGFGISLGLCLAYYAFTLFVLALGRQGHLPAWLAAWLPNILFSGVGFGIAAKIFRK